MCAIKLTAFKVMYARWTLTVDASPYHVPEIVSCDLLP